MGMHNARRYAGKRDARPHVRGHMLWLWKEQRDSCLNIQVTSSPHVFFGHKWWRSSVLSVVLRIRESHGAVGVGCAPESAKARKACAASNWLPLCACWLSAASSRTGIACGMRQPRRAAAVISYYIRNYLGRPTARTRAVCAASAALRRGGISICHLSTLYASWPALGDLGP